MRDTMMIRHDIPVKKATLLCGVSAVMLAFMPVAANALDDNALPSGGSVVSGNIGFDYTIPNELHVNQQTALGVIDWDSFNIGRNALAQFHQTSSSALTVNHVTGDGDPTQILGRLSANGKIMVLDRNGVIFGQGSQVDVAGIIVSTGDVLDVDSDLSHVEIDNVNSEGFIINNGSISVAEAGLAAFVAPTVVNNGIITAKLGRVDLAAGSKATIDLYGDGLIELELDDTTSQVILNTGIISVDGGSVYLQAAAAKDIVNNIVGNTGIIAAKSIGKDKQGKIVLYAEGANKSDAKGISVVINDGYIAASGRGDEETGGFIDVLADAVYLGDESLIDTSGDFGGGSIRIGGDYLGTGDTPTAQYAYIAENSLIVNDAITSGNGGRTIIWSDDTTDFHGSILARGGVNGGSGGFVETSGKINLLADGYVDLTAVNGKKGTYLLDPADITIYGNFAPNYVSTDSSVNLAGAVKLWLDASDPATVNLTYNSLGTTATGTAGTNTITVSANTGLVIGARIRLGAAGSVTAATTIGADTYTITNIAGTTITLSSNLTGNYAGSAIYQGYISELNDKSAAGNNASQNTSSAMPLWLENNQNGLAVMRMDGTDYLRTPSMQTFPGKRGVLLSVFNNEKNGYGALMSTYPAAAISWEWFTTTSGPAYKFWDHVVTRQATTGLDTGNTWQIHSVERTGDTSMVYSRNGVSMETLGIANNQPTAGIVTIGANTVGTEAFIGRMPEHLIYDGNLTATELGLINQYQAAKWGFGLTPPGTGITEAAKAMASDGYGAFTTRYLERLSNTADIVLQASNSITLDFKGDMLNLANDRSISLTTTSGDIKTASAGGVTTNRTGTGGNITFTAGDDIAFDHAFTMNAQNGGQITLNANDTVGAASGLTVTNGTLNVGSQIITGTYTGKAAVMNSNTGTINATTSFDTLDINGAGATLLAGRIGVAGPATQTMANLVKINGVTGTGNAAYTFAGYKIGYVAPAATTNNPALEKISSVIQQATVITNTESKANGTSMDELSKETLLKAKDTIMKSATADCLITLENAGCVVQ